SCTPTSGYSCGTQGATTRSTTLTNACTGSAQVSTLNCGSAGIGTSKSCSGTVTVTAVGGPIMLRPQAELYAVSGATSEFTYTTTSSNACSGDQVLQAGQSCNLITVTGFSPASEGSRNLVVTVTPAGGAAGSGGVTGSGGYGTATVSTAGVSCSATVGLSSTCSGSATITATNGPVVLQGTPVALGGDHPGDFSIAPGSCAGASLNAGQSCSLGAITFS